MRGVRGMHELVPIIPMPATVMASHQGMRLSNLKAFLEASARGSRRHIVLLKKARREA